MQHKEKPPWGSCDTRASISFPHSDQSQNCGAQSRPLAWPGPAADGTPAQKCCQRSPKHPTTGHATQLEATSKNIFLPSNSQAKQMQGAATATAMTPLQPGPLHRSSASPKPPHNRTRTSTRSHKQGLFSSSTTGRHSFLSSHAFGVFPHAWPSQMPTARHACLLQSHPTFPTGSVSHRAARARAMLLAQAKPFCCSAAPLHHYLR